MALAQKAALLAASGLTTLIASGPASAQYFERDRNESVRERPQPDYDPIGVAVGAFRAYATLPLGVSYNDNVFATENNELDDTVFVVAPSAELRSQWSRHFLGIYADLNNQTHNDLESENRTNFSVSSSGRLDVQRGFTVDGQFAHRWYQEARTEASSPANTLEPIDYTDVLVGLGASKEFNRLRFSGRVNHEEFDFDNAILNDGMATVVLQDDRDHEALTFSGRADYAVTDATAVFGAVSSRQRDYALQPNDDPRVAFSRDSKGMTYSFGANFDLTRLVRGEAL